MLDPEGGVQLGEDAQKRTFRRRSSSGPSSSLDASDGEQKRGFVRQASAFMSRTFTTLLTKTADLGLPHERHETITPDGWTLRFKHYPASDSAPPKSHPVMLVHGLSANHRGYDLRKEESLAWILRELGYNVWLIDLRGSGHSEKSRWGKKAVKWDVLAYIEDVKVGIDFVLRHHDAQQVHFIGHSLGGILGFVLLGKWAEYRAKVASLTTLASALYYGDSWWAHLEPMAPLADVIDFLDTRMLMKLYSPFVVWPSFAAHMTNVKRTDLQRLLNHVEKVPTGVFKDMSTSFHADGLALDFGEGPQRVQELMGNIACPVLTMAADFDKQCSVPSIQRTTELLGGSSKKRCVVCGPKPEFRHHYGHVDILIGRHTEDEVFPYITDFLQECDDPAYVASPHKPVHAEDKAASSEEDEETAPLDLETPKASMTTDGGEEEGEDRDEYERLRGVMQERIGVDAGEVLSPMRRKGAQA